MGMIALAIGFLVFVYHRIEWGEHTRIRVYFHHAGALHEGGAFVVAGRTVGEIESIALSRRSAPGPLNGDEGVVVTVALEAREAARLDRAGDVFVASHGALAERYLELGPPPLAKAGTMLREGDQLIGADPASLDRVLQRTWDNLNGFAAFTAQVKPELDALRAQIAELSAHLDPASPTAVAHADMIAPMFAELAALRVQIILLRERGLGGDAGLAHISEVIAATEAFAENARATLAQLGPSVEALRARLDRLRGRFDSKGNDLIAAVELAIDQIQADLAKIDPLLAQLTAVRASIENGDGSILKIMRDPEFPEATKDLGRYLKTHPWKLIDRPPADKN
jgi:ABC-type transporter Mla subunit MlaD